jgi:glycoprotein-N-acetylgalactosamine 3-beta-galactosyltransferase
MNSRDEVGQQRFIGSPLKEILNPDNGIDVNIQYTFPYVTGENCCSKATASFHKVMHDEMYVLEFLIYKLSLFGL